MAYRDYDVLIVGAGPAGIFTALELVRQEARLKIALLDKGPDLSQRFCPAHAKRDFCRHCPTCSIMCGWGGAGAFSDGKLTLSPEVGGVLDEYLGREKLEELISYVDGIYREFGAPDEIYGVGREAEYEEVIRRAVFAGLRVIQVPIRHLGTGRCSEVLARMRDYLQEKVDIRMGCEVKTLLTSRRQIRGVKLADGQVLTARWVVVAPGREGANWLRHEAKRLRLEMAVNPVDIGVRVEVPAVVMEPLTRLFYEFKCIYYSRTFEDKVRTFCMNPYGEVVVENADGVVTVNGHAHAYHKTENTNFAVLVSKSFTEPFKEPIAYGRHIASLANLLGNGVIVQRLGDLLAGRRSTPERLAKGLVRPTLALATPGDLSLVLPYRHLVGIVEMLEALDKLAPGVFSRDTLLYGAEVKFYSSRLKLTPQLETQIKNLFAAGDGAGVTRGLVQASASGVVVAREILRRFGG
ncbi:FAD dependent oxidoreductase [Ammonifex degensii KC4]|uniref:FAD dependent oxidoreductase n=1 Tax=Ammonifex degensii (strain DSM 10501 / KC4) TaxID=429009 RepID=C9RAG4_AMMDK|nr:NAD(P)/FAD-dependent oxidoreductase [Ammonifex degensii]ACX53210.1 FAD dependent oxidoreductase [Ammonifex degensii KC4]